MQLTQNDKQNQKHVKVLYLDVHIKKWKTKNTQSPIVKS